MGRTSDARERLIAAALDLLSERAYSSVGVAEIAKRAEVQKGSFYHFFPSKEALAVAAVDQHWQAQRQQWTEILQADGAVLDRLHALFEATALTQSAALRGTGTVTGCLFGKLALEVSAENETMRERLQAIFEEQIGIIELPLHEAVSSGEVNVADVGQAARAIVAQLEGLVLFARLFNDPNQIDSLWASSLRLLGVAGEVPAAPAAP